MSSKWVTNAWMRWYGQEWCVGWICSTHEFSLRSVSGTARLCTPWNTPVASHEHGPEIARNCTGTAATLDLSRQRHSPAVGVHKVHSSTIFPQEKVPHSFIRTATLAAACVERHELGNCQLSPVIPRRFAEITKPIVKFGQADICVLRFQLWMVWNKETLHRHCFSVML